MYDFYQWNGYFNSEENLKLNNLLTTIMQEGAIFQEALFWSSGRKVSWKRKFKQGLENEVYAFKYNTRTHS